MKPFFFVNLIFYEHVKLLGCGPQVGPFPSRPNMGSIRGEGTPPPTNPSRHLKKKRSELPLKWLLNKDRGRRPTAASVAATADTAAARLRATATPVIDAAASPCLGPVTPPPLYQSPLPPPPLPASPSPTPAPTPPPLHLPPPTSPCPSTWEVSLSLSLSLLKQQYEPFDDYQIATINDYDFFFNLGCRHNSILVLHLESDGGNLITIDSH